MEFDCNMDYSVTKNALYVQLISLVTAHLPTLPNTLTITHSPMAMLERSVNQMTVRHKKVQGS